MAGKSAYVYDVNRNIKEKKNTEYMRTVEYSKAPDTFPCGHVLCHHCIRRYLKPNSVSDLSCPVCDTIVPGYRLPKNHGVSSDSSNNNSGYVENITLFANFDQIANRFNGINSSLRRLKEESVQSKSLAMTYTNGLCNMCEENHGTLKVVQEFNQLAVTHIRPNLPDPYFYRLCTGNIVTSFQSKVNSSCICVPCTYRELQLTRNEHPELEYMAPDLDNTTIQSSLAEVGKMVVRDDTPIGTLQGKNMIEVDHKIRVRERADKFDFWTTADTIKNNVKDLERILLTHVTRQIQDTGSLYHIQESNTVDLNFDETDV